MNTVVHCRHGERTSAELDTIPRVRLELCSECASELVDKLGGVSAFAARAEQGHRISDLTYAGVKIEVVPLRRSSLPDANLTRLGCIHTDFSAEATRVLRRVDGADCLHYWLLLCRACISRPLLFECEFCGVVQYKPEHPAPAKHSAESLLSRLRHRKVIHPEPAE